MHVLACPAPVVEVLDSTLRTLSTGPTALIPLLDVPKLLRLTVKQAAQLVADLVNQGFAEVWNRSVILSAMGAAHVGVELDTGEQVEHDPSRAKWVKCGTAKNELNPRLRGKHARNETDVYDPRVSEWGLDDLADRKAVSPCDELPDRWSSRARDRCEPVGVRPIWVGPRTWDRASGEPCPGCKSKPLKNGYACIIPGCDRIGKEELLDLPPVPSLARPKAYEPGALPGGMGKATGRKVKTAGKKSKPKRYSKGQRRTRKAG
jgi:hypothetical protein